MIWLFSLIAHLWGDYILQSDWMAANKTKSDRAALAHALLYTACFIPVAHYLDCTWQALWTIGMSHYIIDRLRLARYVCYYKNFIAPPDTVMPRWKDCEQTGYGKDKPIWMAMWLMIIADNTLHITINTLALFFWARHRA